MSIRTRFNPLGTIGRKSLLPAGYIELEYLESTGTQWIDTGLTEINDYIFSAKMMPVLDARIFGSGTQAPAFYTFIYSDPSASSTQMYNGSPLLVPVSDFVQNKIQNIKISKEGFSIDEHSYSFEVQPQGIFTTPTSVKLFGYTGSSGTLVGSNGLKIYKYTVKTQQGKAVQYFIPALDPTGRPCMYDLVEQKPYYNKGTGEFQYGAKWLPAGYNGVYGVYFNGSTIVDSGILATTNYDITTRFKVQLGGADDVHVFCGRGTTDQRIFYASVYYGTGFYFGRGSNTTVRVYTAGEYTWHSVFTTSDNHGELNGAPYSYASPLYQYSFPFTMYIGGINSNISPILVSSPFTFRSLSVRDTSTRRLLGDFVPCVNNSTGVYGIYDKVTKNLMPVVQGALMAEQ